MDTEIEEKIICSFFGKRCRDRMIYELKSKQKRKDFFNKIAHNSEDYIDSRYIFMRNDKLFDTETIRKIMCGKDDECYVVSLNPTMDGKFVSFEAAINELWGNGSPYLIYSAATEILYLETEYDFETHCSYILKKT